MAEVGIAENGWATGNQKQGEQGGHRGLGNQGERVGCRATESWRVYESGVAGAGGCGTIADFQQTPWLL